MGSPASATPAMRQYLDAKRQYRDAIVFFRMGDFYEMFYEDALVAARALDLTLTSRAKDAGGSAIPMCGLPYHAMEGYLARLVEQALRPRLPPRREAGGGAPRGLPARHTEGRRHTRPHRDAQVGGGMPGHRSHHAATPRSRHRQRGRSPGLAAARDRSHGHLHGRPV